MIITGNKREFMYWAWQSQYTVCNQNKIIFPGTSEDIIAPHYFVRLVSVVISLYCWQS